MKLRVPLHDLWWLISRAAGVVGIVLLSVAVLLGLAMAARALRDPGRRRAALKLHEDIALIALAAIAVHGLALLGDTWLKPGLSGIAVPFAMTYRPTVTGLGIIAGYLTLLLGPSFYLRRRIQARRWRRLHRFTPVAWVLAAIHTIGAGTDGAALWLRAVVLAPVPVLVYLLIVRLLGARSPALPLPAVRPAQASAPGTVATGSHLELRRAGGRGRVTGQLEPERGSVPG